MRILCIGAHQDDNEFRVGGMAYKWAKAGHEVRFLSMLNGSGGHHIMTPEETCARRYKESQKVAKLLKGKKLSKDLWICTSKAIKSIAQQCGYLDIIEEAIAETEKHFGY